MPPMLQHLLNSYVSQSLLVTNSYKSLRQQTIDNWFRSSQYQQEHKKNIILEPSPSEAFQKGFAKLPKSQSFGNEQIWTVKKEGSNSDKSQLTQKRKFQSQQSPLEQHLRVKSTKISFSFSQIYQQFDRLILEGRDDFFHDLDLLKQFPTKLSNQILYDPSNDDQNKNQPNLKMQQFQKNNIKYSSNGIFDAPQKQKKYRRLKKQETRQQI